VSEADLDTHIEAKWPVIARLRELGAMPFLLFGSSEARNYVQSSVRGGRWLVPIPLFGVGTAAMGLGRAGDPSGFPERLKRFIQTFDRLPGGASVPCLFKFGQVDVEFAYNLSRVRENRPHYDRAGFRQFCARSVERYAGYLKGVTEIVDRARVTVASVFPSSVSDESWAAGFLKTHASVLRIQFGETELDRRVRALQIPDQWERAGMNRYYNGLLRSAAAALGLRFQDDFEILLNAHGVLDAAFIQKGRGQNCHLDIVPTRRELTLLLWELVDSLPGQAGPQAGRA